jgi:hypothetical protein
VKATGSLGVGLGVALWPYLHQGCAPFLLLIPPRSTIQDTSLWLIFELARTIFSFYNDWNPTTMNPITVPAAAERHIPLQKYIAQPLPPLPRATAAFYGFSNPSYGCGSESLGVSSRLLLPLASWLGLMYPLLVSVFLRNMYIHIIHLAQVSDIPVLQ